MNTEKKLTLIGVSNDWKLTITPEALSEKAEALALADTITEVKSQQQLSDCVACASLQKQLRDGVEKSRVQVKEVPLRICRQIDDEARKFQKDLGESTVRLESMASSYQAMLMREAAEKRRVIEEQQEEEREVAMRDKESEQAYLKRKEEEHRVRRLEDLAAIDAAETDDDRENAQIIADQHADEDAEEFTLIQKAINEQEEKRMDSERERIASLRDMEPVKISGAVQKQQKDYEVFDGLALANSAPSLVNIEPKRSLILAWINTPGSKPLAGITVKDTVKIHARS